MPVSLLVWKHNFQEGTGLFFWQGQLAQRLNSSRVEREVSKKEARRQAWIQLLAVGCGIVTSGLAWPVTQKILPLESWPSWVVIVALGLFASGGSGFWNSIQSYLKLIKDLKGLEAEKQKPPPPGTTAQGGGS